jgi:hypothetical protein
VHIVDRADSVGAALCDDGSHDHTDSDGVCAGCDRAPAWHGRRRERHQRIGPRLEWRVGRSIELHAERPNLAGSDVGEGEPAARHVLRDVEVRDAVPHGERGRRSSGKFRCARSVRDVERGSASGWLVVATLASDSAVVMKCAGRTGSTLWPKVLAATRVSTAR